MAEDVKVLLETLAKFFQELKELTGQVKDGQNFRLVNERLGRVEDRLRRFIHEHFGASEAERFDRAHGQIKWNDPSGNILRAINAKMTYLTALMETLMRHPESVLSEARERSSAERGKIQRGKGEPRIF